MKNSDGLRTPRSLVIICVALIAFASLPFLTQARVTSTSVNIINNSSRQVRNAYWSHVDADDWSADLLSQAIGAGQSYNVTDVPCDGQQVKIIAEDQDGCFASIVVTCGQSSSWTITNDTARDCGY